MVVSDLHRSLGLESRAPHTPLATDATGKRFYRSVCPLRLASQFTLNAQDPPDSDGNTASFAWNVSVTATGRVLTISTTDETGVSSPRLLLTLNRQNGEFTGYYITNISGKNVRRNIYGCGLMSQTDEALRARGWVESGVLPTLSTGGWTLQLGQ